jgi:hypothetical protein
VSLRGPGESGRSKVSVTVWILSSSVTAGALAWPLSETLSMTRSAALSTIVWVARRTVTSISTEPLKVRPSMSGVKSMR